MNKHTTPFASESYILFCKRFNPGEYFLFKREDGLDTEIVFPEMFKSICGPFLHEGKILFCGTTHFLAIYAADFDGTQVTNIVKLIDNAVSPFMYKGFLYFVKHTKGQPIICKQEYTNGQVSGKVIPIFFRYNTEISKPLTNLTKFSIFDVDGSTLAFLSGYPTDGKQTDLFTFDGEVTCKFRKHLIDSEGNSVYKPFFFEGKLYYVNASDESDIFIEDLTDLGNLKTILI